jgi:hypothetical protein
MSRLVWNDVTKAGVIRQGSNEWDVVVKPVLGFAYDGLFCDLAGDQVHLRAGGHTNMTPAEVAAVATFIAAQTPPAKQGPTAAERMHNHVTFIQDWMDSQCTTKLYNGILDCVSYTTSGIPALKADATAAVAWRDSVWQYVKQLRLDVQNNVRPVPTHAQLLSELPAITWP